MDDEQPDTAAPVPAGTPIDTVVHVVMADGTEHWGSPYGVLAEHLDRPSDPTEQPDQADQPEQSEPTDQAAGDPEPPGDAAMSTKQEVPSDGAELPAPGDDQNTGTVQAGPSDPQRTAGDTDSADQPRVSQRKTRH